MQVRFAHSYASRNVVMVGFFLVLLFGINISGQTVSQASPPITRDALWQQDLDYFANQFPQDEMDFQKLYPKQEFESQLAAIRQSVPKATDAELTLDLMRLVASAHVAHTSANPPEAAGNTIHFLPLDMRWYSDGLAILAAADEYRDTIGTRVVSIGSMAPKQLETAVAPYISYEMDAGLHVRSPRFMEMVELLQRLGLAEADGSIKFRLARPDGTEFTRKISPPANGHAVGTSGMIGLYDALHIPLPFARKQPGKKYWYEYLSDSQTLFIQYNECKNDPKLPFADFTKAMFDYADAHPVQRVIVDLRFNGGGSSLVIEPLVEGLHAREALSSRGHLYALIGPGTFSSGLMAAMDFHQKLNAILVGEPLAEKLNSYGEVGGLRLPNSRVAVFYSTKFFELGEGSDVPTLAPEIFVQQSFADALAGRDPALEAALKHPLK